MNNIIYLNGEEHKEFNLEEDTIIYHFSIQSYVSQVAKELAVSAGTYGKLSPAMIDRASDRLTNLDVGDFEIAIKVQKYDDTNNNFSPETYGYRAVASAPTSLGLKKKDIIEVYLQSTEKSMLATIANFGMFGGGGGSPSDLRYTAFREEIVRNDPS